MSKAQQSTSPVWGTGQRLWPTLDDAGRALPFASPARAPVWRRAPIFGSETHRPSIAAHLRNASAQECPTPCQKNGPVPRMCSGKTFCCHPQDSPSFPRMTSIIQSRSDKIHDTGHAASDPHGKGPPAGHPTPQPPNMTPLAPPPGGHGSPPHLSRSVAATAATNTAASHCSGWTPAIHRMDCGPQSSALHGDTSSSSGSMGRQVKIKAKSLDDLQGPA